jgi:hypothetical protein
VNHEKLQFPRSAGSKAAYVVKLDSQLKKILFSTLLGRSKPEVVGEGTNTNAPAVDNSGNIYVAGETRDSDFPVTPGALQTAPRLLARSMRRP